MNKEKCNKCGKLKNIKKLISGTCYNCRKKELEFEEVQGK